MSLADTSATGSGSVKTLAIRLEPELHQQLTLLASLQGSTITDEIRTAIAQHIARLKDRPELVAMADSALDEIEREAASRRQTIATLFGAADAPTTTTGGGATSGRSGARKRSASRSDTTSQP